MPKPHELIGRTFSTSTNQLLQVKSVQGETVTLRYLNRPGKEDVTSTIINVNKTVKLEVWKEVKDNVELLRK